MNISERFWEYKGTKQYVWHREFNGSIYGFVHDLVNEEVKVLREDPETGDWVRVHTFSKQEEGS